PAPYRTTSSPRSTATRRRATSTSGPPPAGLEAGFLRFSYRCSLGRGNPSWATAADAWSSPSWVAVMENKRRHSALPMLSRTLSALESAGLATTATFAGILWLGVALPGLPLVPGLGGGSDRNLAISLDSALLGIQDRTGRADPRGRQARLASLLLPSRDSLIDGLASNRHAQQQPLDGPIVVALPAPRPKPPAAGGAPSRSQLPVELASAPDRAPAPAPAPPPPAAGRPE